MAAITELRAQAKKFEQNAKVLYEAADMLANALSIGSPGARPKIIRKSSKRLRQLKDYLTTNGPKAWAEIMDGTKMPKGTISSLLKEENGFTKTDDGKWAVNPAPLANK